MMQFLRKLWHRIFGFHGTADDQMKQAFLLSEGDTVPFFLTPALLASQKNDFAKAHRQINAGLAENPDHPKLLLWRAMFYFSQEKYSDAVAAFRATLKVNPDCEESREMLKSAELQPFT